ncbi:putative ribonuclease H-like domain-containing protein [Tanacetum coccineum]
MVVIALLLSTSRSANTSSMPYSISVIMSTSRYVVPAGRVVVPTGRYIAPAGKVIIIVSTGRLSLVPTGRVLSPGSDNDSDDASFPYLKKDKYEVWAMKMEYWITNNDMNIWKVIQNGNSLKRTRRNCDGRVIILPPTTGDEHIAVQRESKARTTLLQSIPDDHVADFHYMDDARDIWNAVKARISEAKGLHKGYDRMQKILSQLNQLKAKPEDEDINLRFLRALPSSWSQVALTLKTKCELEFLSFDDLYYKLKTLEVDIKGYSTFSSSQSAGPNNSAFVSATNTNRKMSSGNVIEDVLQSFVADTEPEQLAYEDFDQIEKLDLEEMDLKWQMAMLSVRVHKFEQKAGRKIDFDKKESARFNKKKVRCYKCLQRGHFAREYRAKGGNDKQRYSSFKIQEVGKKEEDFKALITIDTLVDWTDHDGQSDGVIASKEFGMSAGCNNEDEIEEVAAKIYNLITGVDSKEVSTAGDAGEFALIGFTFENKSGLGFTNYIGENELGWDDSAFSVFTTNSEEVEGRPHFNRFAKTDSMKVVPPPLTGDYTPLSDHADLDESQMSYGTKSSISGDSNSVSNDFVSCDNNDKSTEVNSNDFASSDLNVKSSEPKSNDSISRASTSGVSTSESEAEIESNVGTPIQEPIIVQDLSSFSCNSSDKNGNTSRTSCNKNDSFNKKAGHFRKHASSVSKLCFYVPHAILLRTRKSKITPARPQSVPTGKPKVPTPVPTENYYTNAEVMDIDSGCSRSTTGLLGKGDIRTPTLDFENVYYVKELQQFNLFSISQICDKKNRVLFTDTDCLVLSKDFKLPDDSMVLLRVPRKHNLYTINLNNLSPKGNLACLVAKASVDESVKWHRRMGHVNYKNMNKLVKGDLVRGLPLNFSRMTIPVLLAAKAATYSFSIRLSLFKFMLVFFLEHKDEYLSSLRTLLNLVENQLNKKVKAIRCDNGTEFKNAHIIELCGSKGIKRDYSNARTPQQNGVAERKNRTLIEAARTMLADSKLPTIFWTEAVRTAFIHFKPFGCHVTILNTSDHLGKFDGKADEGYIVGYSASNKAYRVYNVPNKRVEETMNLRYLEEKPNVQGLGHEWYFDLDYLTDTLGYKRDKTNQSAGTQEDLPNSAGTQDADSDSECDEQVIIIPSYPSHSIQEAEPKDTSSNEGDDSPHDSAEEIFQQELARLKGQVTRATSAVKDAEELQQKARTQTVPTGSIPVPTGSIEIPSGGTTISPGNVSVPTGGVPVPTGSPTDSFFDDEPTPRFPSPSDLGNNEPSLGIFSSTSYDDEFGADLNNLASTVELCKRTTTGESAFISYIHDQQRNNHIDFQHCLFACFLSQVEPRSVAQALEDPSWVDAMQEEMQQFKFQNVWVLVDLPEGKYAIGTKWILKNKRDTRGIVVRNKARLVAQGHRQEEGIDYDEVFALVARIEAIRLFLAFSSYLGFMVYQMDVKSAFLYGRIDEEVYVTQPKGSVDPQHPKKVYKVVKALYGLHQAPRAWYATLSTFLLKHGYRNGTIDKTLFLKKHKRDIILVQVYVDDIIFGSTKQAWCDEFEALMKGQFEMSAMGELTLFLGLQVQQIPDGIFINQEKYVQEILKKFDLECVRTATTPYEAPKPKSKNEPDSPVNVHLYRSMIGSLMYLTASRPDIMFAVSACSRNQVTPTTSNLEAVKKIFKYLKGQPKLGLWYPRESPFVLEAYSDSDYARANKDRKSTTGGCQFLGRRLISWQCKKQTIVATSSTEAEYVAAANCCGQVLWIQNQLLDYGYNFMNTKIFIDNQSTICIVKNPVFHQRTKHIEIRHHFIRDANDKKLIQVLKIHTDDNVADLLTKAFDGPRFNHLVVNIGMLNP